MRCCVFVFGSDCVGYENVGCDDDVGGICGFCCCGIVVRYFGMGRGRDASGVRIVFSRAL